MCSGHGDPCDDVCGGAGCGKCGGASSCQDGAVTKATNAKDFSHRAESFVSNKSEEVDSIHSEVRTSFNHSIHSKVRTPFIHR